MLQPIDYHINIFKFWIKSLLVQAGFIFSLFFYFPYIYFIPMELNAESCDSCPCPSSFSISDVTPTPVKIKVKKRVHWDPSIDDGPTFTSTMKGLLWVIACIYIIFVGRGAMIQAFMMKLFSYSFHIARFVVSFHNSVSCILRGMPFNTCFSSSLCRYPVLCGQYPSDVLAVARLNMYFTY